MTAVEWLHDKWSNCKEWKWEEIEQWFEQATLMEYKQNMDAMQRGMELQKKENNRIGFRERNGLIHSQTEISDEDIEKEALSYFNEHHCNVFEYNAFIAGVKWYREQLKKKQCI